MFLISAQCTSVATTQGDVAQPQLVGVSGFYTESQAARGQEMFRSVCSECHDTNDFRGEDFEWEWRRQTAWDLYETMAETMPEDAPGSLSPQSYAAILAYILSINAYPAGSVDLAPDQGSMDAVPLGPNADKTGRNGSLNNDGR